MPRKLRALGPTTLLALAAFAAALLFVSPAAQPAPGDVADLAVTKADSPDPVNVGETLTYTIRVTNAGPQDATNVVVEDRIPPQMEFVAATSSSGICQRKARTVTCNVGNLNADPTGANAITVTVQVLPVKKGTFVNTVSVNSVENDPVGTNDSADASTRVVEPRSSTCRGIQATVVGTPGSDRLFGTAGPDVIAGLGGGDVIFSYTGRDLICSGGGNDRVVAGPALDRVFGGRGSDRLLGRGGPDLLAGNPGSDTLKGNRGSDRLRGGTGRDRCRGGSGLDIERSC